MNVTYVFSKLYVVCEWIMNLLLLNVLFIFFSLAGFIIFGVSPAMTSLFKRLYEGQDVRIIPTFYQSIETGNALIYQRLKTLKRMRPSLTRCRLRYI